MGSPGVGKTSFVRQFDFAREDTEIGSKFSVDTSVGVAGAERAVRLDFWVPYAATLADSDSLDRFLCVRR